jgi:outer membrane protein insertion porin family
MMRIYPRAFLLSLSFVAVTSAFAQVTAPGIRSVRFHATEEIDVPALLDLLGLKEGDTFDQDTLDRGLIRLALTNDFQRVEAGFDPSTGLLDLNVELHNRLDEIEIVSNQPLPAYLKESLLTEVALNQGDVITADLLPGIRSRALDLMVKRGLGGVDVVPAIQQRRPGSQRDLRIFVEFSNFKNVRNLAFAGFERRDQKFLLEELKSEDVFNPVVKRLNIPEFRRGKLRQALILDFVAFEEVRRRFLKRLKDRGHYDAQLDWDLTNNAAGEALLTFQLVRGHRYNLQFRGNTAFWENDLRESILERSVQLGLPFSLFEAELRITTLYKEKGYKDLRIEREILDEGIDRLIIFHIHEGKQFFWGKTYFKGVPQDSEDLLAQAVERWLRPFKSPYHYFYYQPDDILSLLGGLVTQIRDLGFLDFKIYSYRFNPRPESRFFDLELTVQLGQRYRYRNISLSGMQWLPKEQIQKLVKIKEGDYVEPTKVFKLAGDVRNLYQNNGYIQVNVSSTEEELLKMDRLSSTVDVQLSINPGPQVLMGKAILDGNNKTKDPVILRELTSDNLAPGKPMGPERTKFFEENLYGLGLFQLVEMRPVGGKILQREDNVKGLPEVQEKDLKITLKERPGGSIEFGPGYRTDLGLIGFAELNYRNLGGWNRGVFLRSQLSRKLDRHKYQFMEQKHTAIYVEPYLFDWPLRFRTQFEYVKSDDIKYLSNQKVSGFNSEELFLNFSVEKELFQDFTWTHTLYDYNISKIFDIIKAPDNRQNYYRIASVGTGFALDKRDSIFEPRKGYHFQTNVQLAMPELGGDDDAHFVIWKQRHSFYVPIPNRAVLAFSGSYSRLWGLEKSSNIPENKRLVLGGRTSIRSLSEKYLRFDEKGVLDQQSLELRAELRQSLFQEWGVAFFLEGGQVDVLRTAGDPMEKMSTGFRKATGIGLRYSTPVGPLSMDFAFNIDQEPGENEYRLNLSIGSF